LTVYEFQTYSLPDSIIAKMHGSKDKVDGSSAAFYYLLQEDKPEVAG
jgi:hypothetical protein